MNFEPAGKPQNAAEVLLHTIEIQQIFVMPAGTRAQQVGQRPGHRPADRMLEELIQIRTLGFPVFRGPLVWSRASAPRRTTSPGDTFLIASPEAEKIVLTIGLSLF